MAKKKESQFAILGIGRFGLSILQTLSEYDVNVLACDKSELRVQEAVEYATHVVQADFSDEITLKQLGLGNFDVVIIAIEELETALLATMIAKEQGVPKVIVKANGHRPKKILESIGADQVILPEYEIGAKLAHKLAGTNTLEVLENSEHYVITEMQPMTEWIGKTIRQADIRRKHNLLILGIRHNNKLSVSLSADRVIREDDVLIALSEREKPKL